VPVTERDQLAAAARAAGLRLSAADQTALLPAWKRYLSLVEQLRAAVVPEDADDIV
jgi:post-segregation antitoxin (ccd killing protein)